MQLFTWSNAKNDTRSLSKIPFHLNICFHLSVSFPHILKEWLVYVSQINCFLYHPSEVARSHRHTISPAELWCVFSGKLEVICHTDTILRTSKLRVFLLILQSYNSV